MRQFFYIIFLSGAAFSLESGQKAVNFSLKAIDGKEYEMERALKSKPLLVVAFIATKCPYSNAYNQRYKEIQDALMQRNKVTLFMVNSNKNETKEEIKAHSKENGFTFPILLDEGHKVADLFGAERTPEVYLLNQNKEILYHGRIDDDTEGKNIKRQDLMAAVDEAISNKKVTIKETKSFGCSIKR